MIADGERWSEWLVDSCDVDVRPGSGGVVRDDGSTREVRVDRVDEGERVTFDWSDGDERSRVELEIVRIGDRPGLRVTETFASACRSVAQAMTAQATTARAMTAWDVRLLVLCLGTAALART